MKKILREKKMRLLSMIIIHLEKMRKIYLIHHILLKIIKILMMTQIQ